MKRFSKIIIILICLLSFGGIANATNYIPNANNVPIGGGGNTNKVTDNSYLNEIGGTGKGDIVAGTDGQTSVVNLLYTIAKDLKTVMYIVAGIFFLIIAIRVIVAGGSDEEVTNFKKGLVWISLGIVVMQLAYYFVYVLYIRASSLGVGGTLAELFIENILTPLIELLETGASFFFLAIAIFAFYKMVTTNGDEEKAKEGKMTIAYAIIGFLVVKLAKELIYAVYGDINCQRLNVGGILQINGNKCIADNNLSGVLDIIVRIINWLNGLVGIAVLAIIIYAGVQVLFANGDEEKLSKAKRAIVYVAIGIGILAMNYFIMTFFILPEVAI